MLNSSIAIPCARSQAMFSVLILTLNEERNLPRCLASLKGIDDIVVLDSGSRDRTHAIAAAAGARVLMRPFDNFANQRNHAQLHISFRHPWVFHLDADEEILPPLIRECAASAARVDVDGFLVAPKMIFAGRWIRRCTDYPAYQARFVRAPQFRFVQVGHGQREAPEMRLARLTENYLHRVPNDADEWFAKHQRYARDEAEDIMRNRRSGTPRPKLASALPLERRRALKALSDRLPFRGPTRFCYQYFLRGGFLEGRAGFRYCTWLARYETLIAKELRALAHR